MPCMQNSEADKNLDRHLQKGYIQGKDKQNKIEIEKKNIKKCEQREERQALKAMLSRTDRIAKRRKKHDRERREQAMRTFT